MRRLETSKQLAVFTSNFRDQTFAHALLRLYLYLKALTRRAPTKAQPSASATSKTSLSPPPSFSAFSLAYPAGFPILSFGTLRKASKVTERVLQLAARPLKRLGSICRPRLSRMFHSRSRRPRRQSLRSGSVNPRLSMHRVSRWLFITAQIRIFLSSRKLGLVRIPQILQRKDFSSRRMQVKQMSMPNFRQKDR